MARPLANFFGAFSGSRRAVETIATRRTLDQALAQVTNHDLIFRRWGLGERHPTGLGLAFNFAGPPGTGKTICAEAIAHALGKKLLIVNYAEVHSMWAGETSKNVASVFRTAAEQGAVLLFDEAAARGRCEFPRPRRAIRCERWRHQERRPQGRDGCSDRTRPRRREAHSSA